MYSQEYRKVLYLENRRYLPQDSALRSDTRRFTAPERRPPHSPSSLDQALRDGREVAELHKRALHEEDERRRKKARTAANRLEKSTGKKGTEELARLPYYSDVEIPVELMHTVQVNI